MIWQWRSHREMLPRLLCGYPMVVVVLAAQFLATVTAVLEKSNTYDEIAHVTGGYSYWVRNDYRLHPENGNLPQRRLALPLLAMDLRLPANEDAWACRTFGTWGSILLRRGQRRGSDALARCMNALLAVALGTLVYAWSRRLFGPGGGMLSLLLYATSPTILANGGLATADLAAAAFFTLSVGCLWRCFTRCRLAPSSAFAWLRRDYRFPKCRWFSWRPMAAVLLILRPRWSVGR